MISSCLQIEGLYTCNILIAIVSCPWSLLGSRFSKVSFFSKIILDRDFFKFRLTPWKAEQPLRGMELGKEVHKKIKTCRKSVLKEPTGKKCLLILDLKQFRSQVIQSYISVNVAYLTFSGSS